MKSTWDNVFPSKGEYGEFYQTYIDPLDKGNVVDMLSNQRNMTYSLINSLDDEQALHRYAEDKWTVKEVFGHMIDTERIFSYRALCFSRNDATKLPGFDQDDYVEGANFNERSLAAEYLPLRN